MALWGYIVMYMIVLYTLNYYEDKYLLVFLCTLSTKQEYIPQFYAFIKNKHK